jgi:uncharacterized protein (TIGR03435 family)
MRAIPLLLFLAASVPAQTVTFEAAAIKAPDPADSGSGWNSTNAQMEIKNMNLRQLVMVAYDVRRYQVEGGPKWLDGDRWTIVAKLPPGVKNDRNDGAMRLAMQSLLAERYQLTVHRETKPMSAYALTVAKGGPKLTKSDYQGSSSYTGRGKATFRGVSMERLARNLSSTLDRPVADETGVEGKFDFTLEWSPDEDADKGPSIFTAMQEQLGLKLEARKLPIETIVIDRAEKPSEN